MTLPRSVLMLSALLLGVGIANSAPAAPPPVAGVTHGELVQAGNSKRSYRLFVPQGLAAGKPAPLVIALHGGLGTGDIFAKQTGFDAVAQRQGFVVAYPDGLGKVFNAGRCCGKAQADDVGFVRALVADLKTRLPIDAKRVYGMGFSNGAMLVHRVACEAPEVFAAIAPVAGGIMVDRCPSKQPVSALLIQGRLDKRIPWEGGVFDGTRRPSMAEVVQSIASRGQCGPEMSLVSETPTAQCWSRRCTGGVALQWCGLPTVGHQWAGGATYFPRLLGPNTADFDTSAAIGAFFAQLPR